MGFDTIAQHGDSFVAFDSYAGQVAIAFGGAWAPDRMSVDSVRLICPDVTLRNGFHGAKFSLRTLRNDNRNYHPAGYGLFRPAPP